MAERKRKRGTETRHRSTILTVRVSPDEAEKIRTAAGERQVSVGSLLRDSALAATG